MRLLMLFTLLLSALQVSAQKKVERELRAHFTAFTDLMMAEKYREASMYCDSGTRDYMEDLKVKAVSADSSVVANLPVFERIIVFGLRHRTLASDALSMEFQGFFEFLCRTDILSKVRLEGATIEKVEIQGKTATVHSVNTFQNKTETTQWRWNREGKEWKMDLAASFRAATVQMEESFNRGFMPANDRIFLQLERTSGTPVQRSIWHPITDY